MISVIFDMDGTLLDTQRIAIPAWEYAGNMQGISGVGAHTKNVFGTNHNGSNEYLRKNFPQMDIEKFKEDSRKYMIENMVVRFKPGAEKLLDFLDENGIKYAIESGTSRPSIEHHLKELGIMERFSAIVGGLDVENGKPAPDVFLLAAEKIGAEPESCFVFEDSENGVRAGYAAGMRVFGIADVVGFCEDVKNLMFKELDSLDEAIDILKKYL